jgi:tripartite-type tricarboxylate transporter receptor subunit TctC
MNRRNLLGLGAAATLSARPAFAQAPAWPVGPVRKVVPFAAGGPTDVPARLLADQMSNFLPHRMVVENRTGSGVVIGTDAVAKAARDGQTILYTTVGHAYLPGLFDRLPFDPVADFTPAAFIGQIPQILMVHKDFPAQTLPDLIRLLRENPGKYDYASSGNGGAVHLATELFLHAAGGLRVNHIPYRGSSAALPDVLSGRVPMIFDIAASALPYVRSNQLRALGISTKERSPLAPEIPTMIEQGVAGYEAYTWHMVMARSGTPPAIIQQVNQAVNRAVNVAAVKERLLSFTMQVVSDSTPESAAAYLRSEMAVWEPLVRAAGIRAS